MAVALTCRSSTLTATMRCSDRCHASYTVPMPPRPISRRSSKSPRIMVGDVPYGPAAPLDAPVAAGEIGWSGLVCNAMASLGRPANRRRLSNPPCPRRVPQPRPRQNLPIVVDGPGAGLVCENSHFHPGLTQSQEPDLVAVTLHYPTAERRRIPSDLDQPACWDASPTVTTLPYIRLGAFSIPQSRLKPKCNGVAIPANDPVRLHYIGWAMTARTAN